MKLTTSGSGDHKEDHPPTWHEDPVLLLVTVQLIGSKSILLCEGALLDLGTADVTEGKGGRDFGKAQISPTVFFLQVLCAKLVDTSNSRA